MKKFLIYAFLLSVFFSCTNKTEDNSTSGTITTAHKESLHKLMLEAYFWYQYVPQTINYETYPSLENELSSLIYKDIDKWSFIIDTVTYKKMFLEGENAGYGLAFSSYNNSIYISKVDKNSPAESLGIKRGFRLISINGTLPQNLTEAQQNEIFASKSGIKTTFQIADKNGNTKDYAIISAAYTGKEVFKDTIVTVNSTKVGYIAYKSFLGNSINEFQPLFSKLKAEKITELVIDLRDNGGGSINIADTLIGYISPASAKGKICTKIKHNVKYQSYDKTFMIPTLSDNLDLKRIFFLVNKNSASASELTMSALKPYMDVQIIGSYTHGKPVGMEGFAIAQYAVFPISFAYYNANDYGDYFKGIPPSFSVVDNYQDEFGNPSELYFKTALYYIEKGNYPNTTLALKSSSESAENNIFQVGTNSKPLAFIPLKK